MKKYLLIISCSSLLGLFSGIAESADLLNVFNQAVVSDPEFQAAYATKMANEEGVAISRSALLTQISGSGYAQTNHVNITTTNNSLGLSQGTPVGNPIFNGFGIAGNSTYNTHGYTLNAAQPIFNFADWMLLRQAQATAAEANYTYGAELQALIIRVATAYFNVLLAQDTLTATVAQKQANLESLQQIKAKFEVGLETMTDVDQAQASYDNLVAQEISANNNVTNAMQALKQITDQTYAQLAPLKNNMPLINPNPIDLSDWITVAEQNNLTLLASRYSVQAQHEFVRANFANNFPSLDAVGSYGHNVFPNSITNAFPGRETENLGTLGVQLTVPIISGGLTVAQTEQAEDNYVAASDQMEETHRLVVFNANQAYNNVMANISKIKADRLAIISNNSALNSINAGFQAGTKTLLDVLTAQQNLYQAETTHYQDQYNYILSTLELKQAAGSLTPKDLIEINGWLQDDHLLKVNNAG